MIIERLYQMLDEVCAFAGEHVDDGNLYHRIAAGLQAHRGTGYVDEYLTCEGGVVDAHVELQTLVLGLAADTLADEVHAVAHVTDVVDALHLEHVGLVGGEVGIGLDVLGDVFELGAVFQLHIDHAAVDALAEGDGHGEGVLNTFLRAYADAVTHRHAGAEVGVGESLRSEALHECAHDAVGTRVPACGNHADGAGLLVEFHQTLPVAAYVGVDVERVDGVDAQGQYHVGILLTRAGGGGEDGHIDILQFADVLHHVILCQFCGLVLCTIATYDACHFHVGGCLQCLECILSDVAVTYDGGSDFLHIYKL